MAWHCCLSLFELFRKRKDNHGKRRDLSRVGLADFIDRLPVTRRLPVSVVYNPRLDEWQSSLDWIEGCVSIWCAHTHTQFESNITENHRLSYPQRPIVNHRDDSKQKGLSCPKQIIRSHMKAGLSFFRERNGFRISFYFRGIWSHFSQTNSSLVSSVSTIRKKERKLL